MGQTAFGDFRVIDDLHYHYEGNRLIALDDDGSESDGGNDFSDRGTRYEDFDRSPEYRYDRNGNMVRDDNKGIVRITYNHLNLPEEIYLEKNRAIHYLYDASGRLLRKKVYGEGGYLESVTDYAGSFVYIDDSLAYCTMDLGRILFDGTDYRYEYHLKDHLGNVRVCFVDSVGVPVVTQENHYYPFGLAISGLSYDRPEDFEEQNPYRYNGKPFQPENGLNWYNYGARFYDPQVGRWWSVDPAAESMKSWSPYNYTFDNPIRFIDPDGSVPDGYYNPSGEYQWFDNESDDIIFKNDQLWIKFANDKETFKLAKAASQSGINSEYGASGEIKKSGFLISAENWLESPSEGFGEGTLKVLANIGYSVLNSPVKLATGKSLGGTPANSTEKTDAFMDVAPGLLVKSLTVTKEVVKVGKGLKGYNKFVKEVTGATATKGLKPDMKWQTRAGELFSRNKTSQKGLTDFTKIRRATSVVITTEEELNK